MSDAGGRHPAGVPDLGLFLPELRRLPSPAVDVSAGDESPVVSYPVSVSATLLVFQTRDLSAGTQAPAESCPVPMAATRLVSRIGTCLPELSRLP